MTKNKTLFWTIVGSASGGIGVALLVGQLLFSSGAKTGTFTTQEQLQKTFSSVKSTQKDLRKRIRQLEIISGARSVQIQSINKKLDSVDGKLDQILYMFQRQPPRVWKGRKRPRRE